MSSSVIALIIAALVAAVVVRRKVGDPQNPFGIWLRKNLAPRMAAAAKVVAYLTLAVWILIFFLAPEEDRGSVGELMKSFRNAIGLEETKNPNRESVPPPFRIPEPGERAKPEPAKR
ncbi:MAG: hypothetical protein HN377_07545 [Alphaproteobacteria bacterium]|nr:hypothetical protein [Alphaproteobacteria bacterium]MBT7944475.1 hypothetical protein [Alphaproteobacteria bacterium]